jgi:hypothetical protein
MKATDVFFSVFFALVAGSGVTIALRQCAQIMCLCDKCFIHRSDACFGGSNATPCV